MGSGCSLIMVLVLKSVVLIAPTYNGGILHCVFDFPSSVKIKPFSPCYECAVEEISGNQTEQECSTGKNGMILVSPHLCLNFFEIGNPLLEWRVCG